MKRMILSVVLVLAISAVSFGKKVVAEGKTYSALGDYKVQTTDNPIQMKGEDCKAYVITYENSPMEVTVIVCKEKNCKKYVVLSDKLSVQYVCNANYFGVEKIGKEFEAEGYKTSDSALNRSEYFHQKVLGPGMGTELDNTKLIAAFFPMLLNESVVITASR